jgi:2'-5' RNA ligase
VKSGIIILSELHGPLRERILEIQRRFDPRLAAGVPPHLTLSGSSGMGPIPTSTTVEELRDALEPVTRETAPMTLMLLPPIRFMQTNVVVLPLDPNGPVRALHERIKNSGLAYEQPRFTFTPHVTLSFFRELSPQDSRALLAIREPGPVTIDRISAHRTVSIVNSQKLIELPLSGRSRSLSP